MNKKHILVIKFFPRYPSSPLSAGSFCDNEEGEGEAGEGLFHEEALCPLALSVAFCLICFFFFNFIGV